MSDENLLKQNIIKSGAAKTSFGENAYSNLWYVDLKNKLCVTFTPRGGCSISFQQYLDLLGLLDEALKYDSFIHEYRMYYFIDNIPFLSINILIEENYIFIKFIMNPYIRAVSIYNSQTSHNFSFRQFLRDLIDNKHIYLSQNDSYHYHPQYIEGEEKIITKYIKINENEKYIIKLHDGTDYELDVNKYTSIHHGKKTDHTDFCGDKPLNDVKNNLPKSYKYFYDDEIKNLVDIFYKNDIEKYGFKFDF
jgi:hypothetical protein